MLESLKCEVIGVYWLSAYPSCVRWFCVGCALPLIVEVVFERGVVYSRLLYMREELCTPGYCIAPNPQWRFPVWEVLCIRVSRNPSV